MTITQDICYQRLVNLHQPGGESTLSDGVDFNNKIAVKFNKGGLYTDKLLLEGQIVNLKLSSDAVIDPFCTEYDCIEEGGAWSTALTSDISRDNNGVTEYWISGSLDSDGSVWVLDLGIISESTGAFLIKDVSVPINSKGFFKSRITLPQGIKLAILKKVSGDSVHTVLHYFGEYKSKTKITRTSIGYLLNYNSSDQVTDLEVLSIGLLNLIFSNYKTNNPNETIYYIKGELDFFTKKIINDNIAALSKLIDFKSTNKRLHSIPKTLTTYLTPDILYDDNFYINNVVKCVGDDCVDTECLEEGEVFLASSREVSTRAVAWFYLFVYSYTIYLNTSEYAYLLDLLAFYLANQINPTYNLPSKGWTHANVFSESTEILEYNLSTSVAVYIALMKHYNYTSTPAYLEYATDIEEGIWSQLYNYQTKSFVHSLSDSNLQTEELAYALLFSNLVNRSDVVEAIVEFIDVNSVIDYGIVKESLDGINIINQDKLTESYLTSFPLSVSFVNLPTNAFNLIDIASGNLLLVYALDIVDKSNYFISNKLKRNIESFLQALASIEKTNSLFYLTSCVSDNLTFGLEPIKEGEYYLTSNLSFQRSFLLNKFLSYIPIDFGWFTKKALQLSGNTYKIVKSITKFLATFNTFGKDIITNNFALALKGKRLNDYLSNFKITRIPQETDSDILHLFTSTLSGKEIQITASGLTNKLKRYNLASTIKDNYVDIFNLNTTANTYNYNIGEGKYSGNLTASTNIVTITIPQPINFIISKEVVQSLPIAVKAKVIEVITLLAPLVEIKQCGTLTIQDYVFEPIEEEPEEFYYLLLETEPRPDYVLIETEFKIPLEEGT